MTRQPLYRTVLNVVEIAPQLTAKKPFFKSKSGGLYAVKTTAKGLPVCFVRVDKDDRSPKIRKAERRASRQLAKEANSNGRTEE